MNIDLKLRINVYSRLQFKVFGIRSSHT